MNKPNQTLLYSFNTNLNWNDITNIYNANVEAKKLKENNDFNNNSPTSNKSQSNTSNNNSNNSHNSHNSGI